MEDALLWATAIGSVVTAVATISLVVVAAWTLGGAKKQLVLQTEQAEREGRPYVTAEVVPGLHGAGHWDLVLRNYGKTSARSVVMFCTDLRVRDDDDHISPSLISYLATPRALAPGARERVMWRMDEDAHGRLSEAGAPGKTSVEVTYSDGIGNQYADTYAFDVDSLGAAAPAPTEGPSAMGNGKELANIERALRTLNAHVGELRR